MELDSLPVKNGFRLRGEAVTRLETLVDAAFAFALSMLVISVGTLPKDVPDLFLALHRVPTFAACSLLIFAFWSAHDRWSRRFGIDDPRATNLSFLLVFTMLVFVYPLRMVVSGGLYFFTGGWVPSDMDVTTVSDLENCFVIYGLGFTALNLILWRLNHLALKQAGKLELDGLEVLDTRREMGSFAIQAALGVVSIVLALCLRNGPAGLVGALPGFIYSLLGVFQPLYHGRMGRARHELLLRGTTVRGGRVLQPDDVS